MLIARRGRGPFADVLRSRRRRVEHGKRRNVKDVAMVADSDRFLVAVMRQWNNIRRAVSTEQL